ncbi:MAG: tRNA uridine(34) 5-carboxymethylaminomethyl modification radical SAM/GNAT enzyme Elp3 [Patescibacteria group bacterium]|nr:tRNA uridine(34) 5-carboxymethylaminomethyl modification radical SAM/GNAT enzyme Elp3 [Patescibacteria group bacterium]
MNNLDRAKKELILRASTRGIIRLREFMILKNEISEEFKIDSLPNYGLTQVYEKLIKAKKIEKNVELEKLLRKAKMRTLSGVAVVSVLTKEYNCPGNCLYCPTEKGMPKSYLSNEPAVMRAILAKFDPYRQVEIRLRALEQAGHSIDKIELIIMGGSFNALPLKYQYWFVKECFRACNGFGSKYNVVGSKGRKKIPTTYYLLPTTKNSLEKIKQQLRIQQTRNETIKRRIIGLTLETRPDLITEDELKKFLEMGCTRIEIGVQSVFDDVLEKNKRGHGANEIVEATKLMKDFGFKVSYHMMPGLYGSNLKKDLEMFKTLFSDGKFQPDQIKIYPCVVVKNSQLYRLWKQGKYKPYTNKQLIKLICEIKKIIPPYVRISRLIRDIPEESIEAGNKITNLRQVIANRSQLENWKCQCIRCREIRDKKTKNQENKKAKGLRLHRINYEASGGKEVFLGLVDNDYQLYALLRLRLPSRARLIAPLQNSAIIREVHTYGEALDIGDTGLEAKQHKGLGRQLILEAEKIAKKSGYKKISVISGVGAREYYKRLGYRLEKTYMVKTLK